MAPAGTRAAVERICATEPDDRVLRARVLEALRREVGADWYVWVLTDPGTTVGASPLAAIPDLRTLPDTIRARYLSRPHRWTALPDARAVRASASPAGADPWREVLRALGVADVLSVVLRDRHGCWAFLDLWRSSGHFGDPEAALVSELVPVLTRGVRRTVAATFAARGEDGAAVGPGVLVLSPDLRPHTQTPATDALLRALLPTGEALPGPPPVPAAAMNVGAQLLAVEAGTDRHEPSARVHLREGRWLTVRAARLGGPAGDLAVTFEATAPDDRADLFARAHGLSPRETQLLHLVRAGLDTAQLAARLHVSANTVQDHLKSVFAKTGTRSRSVLVARATGSPR